MDEVGERRDLRCVHPRWKRVCRGHHPLGRHARRHYAAALAIRCEHSAVRDERPVLGPPLHVRCVSNDEGAPRCLGLEERILYGGQQPAGVGKSEEEAVVTRAQGVSHRRGHVPARDALEELVSKDVHFAHPVGGRRRLHDRDLLADEPPGGLDLVGDRDVVALGVPVVDHSPLSRALARTRERRAVEGLPVDHEPESVFLQPEDAADADVGNRADPAIAEHNADTPVADGRGAPGLRRGDRGDEHDRDERAVAQAEIGPLHARSLLRYGPAAAPPVPTLKPCYDLIVPLHQGADRGAISDDSRYSIFDAFLRRRARLGIPAIGVRLDVRRPGDHGARRVLRGLVAGAGWNSGQDAVRPDGTGDRRSSDSCSRCRCARRKWRPVRRRRSSSPIPP